MAEPGDSDSGPFREHNFKSAREQYKQHARQRVNEAREKDEPMEDLVPASIIINCLWPLLLGNDLTGSVGKKWLEVQFSKFPYLYIIGKILMGEDLLICFGGIGDSHDEKNGGPPDKYYLQAIDAVDEHHATEAIKRLNPEGGGGGQAHEDYQLWVLYALYNIHAPKARRKPLLILNGDEAPYDGVSKELAEKVHVNIGSDISTAEIFRLAKQKYTIYMVRKQYGGYEEHEIHCQWVRLLGDSHVCVLRSPDRVVDTYFGIMAKEAGKIPWYIEELRERQTPKQFEEVMEILEPIFADDTPDDSPVEAESDEGVETAPLV